MNDKYINILENKFNIINRLSDENKLEEYIKSKTIKEKIEFILKIIINSNLIRKITGMPKDEKEFEKLEIESKTMYKRANDSKTLIATLKLFTKSIAFAPYPSVKLALAYANRSIVLFKLNLYSECLEDIERALALNYPDHLKAKILFRKTKCLIILKRNPEANNALKDAQHWLKETSRLNLEEKIKFFELQKLQLFNKYGQIKQSVTDDSTEENELSYISSFNDEVPYASDAVAIEYNEDYGRHVIATRDIQPGEVIAVEKPYTLLLDQDEIYTHCSNCLKVCWANIPCKRCAYSMYCSKKCRDDEWKKCHDVECDVLPALIENCDIDDLLSLRLAVLALKEAEGDMEQLKRMAKRLDECDDPRTSNFSHDGKLHSDKYAGIYNLSISMYSHGREELYLLSTCIIIYFLATRTEIFGTKLSDLSTLVKNDNVIFFGDLILRHQGIISRNYIPFNEAYNNEYNYYGVTVMSFGSLINHSCNPNVLIQSRPQHLTMHAIYPIQKDEQLFVSYGFHFYNDSKKQRRRELEYSYSFECNCVACQKEWPTSSNLLQPYMTLVKEPENRTKIKQALQNLELYRDIIDEGNVDDKPYLIEELLKMVRVLHNYAPLPCLETTIVFKLLSEAYMITGNRFKLPQK